MSCIVSEYKTKSGKTYPTIVINMGKSKDGKREFTFSFGLSKAKAILDNLESIADFVKTEGKTE